MSDQYQGLLQYPASRVTYPGIDNPFFIDDIQAANEMTLAVAAALTGLGPTDFAIVAGMNFDGSTNYTAGVFWLNGNFYYMPNSFTTTQALQGSQQPQLSEGFTDGVNRTIYNVFMGSAVGAAVPGTTSPAFTGNMDTYRVGGKRLMTAVNALNVIAGNLKAGAFAAIGSTPGTVMAGDDPRAPYTGAQLDARYAQTTQVIVKGAGTAYTPAAATDPANKGYVDTNAIQKFASGFNDLGDADPVGGTLHTISLGLTLPSNFYKVLFTIESLATNPATDTFYQVPIRNKTASSFDLYFREATSGVQHIIVNWLVCAI